MIMLCLLCLCGVCTHRSFEKPVPLIVSKVSLTAAFGYTDFTVGVRSLEYVNAQPASTSPPHAA